MEKEKVLEIESQEVFGDIAVRIKYVNIEKFEKNESKKGNCHTQYKDDELNFEIIKFKDGINRERYKLNLESVSVDEECFVDITNLKISVYSKKVFEEIKKMIDLINEKYGIPKRWRAEKGGVYLYIKSTGEVTVADENRSVEDIYRYELGNYFEFEKQAVKVKNSKEWKEFWAKVRAGEIGGESD